MPHVMVVDDEAPIRQLVARVLERKGHAVAAFGSSKEALAFDGPIDVLLVDLILPDMNGRQLAELIRERYPQLPVVLMSGYPPQHDLTPAPPSAFLQKPMAMNDVLAVVDQILAGGMNAPES